tara:strand:- start:1275 stop:2195 length:921 start_codon:yes stop_codon:yes gene_type:complete
MHYVVTGGAGFIGSNITKKLVSYGHDVSVIDNLNTGKLENLESVKNRIKFYKMDIRSFDEINGIIRDADGIFHQAALTVVQDSYTKTEEYIDVNVTGTENIFRSAKVNNLKVVFASSSSVYGDVQDIPISEEFEKNPINPYGKTKLDDEFLAEKFWNDGVHIIGLRYFNVYGKGQNKAYAGVITKFLDRINKKENLEIFGTGKQVRDFIFVEDVARANISAMTSKVKNGFFNVGTGEKISIEELGKMMIKISKSTLDLKYITPLEGDVNLSQADKELSKRLLGWESKKKLQSWLKDIFEMDIEHGK